MVAEHQPILVVVEREAFGDGLDGVGQPLLALRQGGLLGRLARGDLAPGADHLERIAVLVLDQVLLVAHPAIDAVGLAEAVLGDVAAFFEQLGLPRLDLGEILGMDARAPEVRILQILVGLVAQHPLDVVADEGRRIGAAGLEAVDHRRGAMKQQVEARPRRVLGLLGLLARGDIAPGADDLDRLAVVAAQQILLVADPDVIAVALAEAVLGGVSALLEQLRLLGLDRGKILGMDVAAPEIGVLKIFLGAIAEQALDVLADEGRRVVAARLEAVDYRRRAFEQGR